MEQDDGPLRLLPLLFLPSQAIPFFFFFFFGSTCALFLIAFVEEEWGGRYTRGEAAAEECAGEEGSRKRRPPEKPQETGAAVAVEAEAAAGVRQSHPTSPLPKPPAGFVLDAHGRVLAAASKRIATIEGFPKFPGDECMLLCPVDTPVQILKSTNFNGWSAVNDDEVEAIIPSAAYALAKIHMHLVVSGFCYTARGVFATLKRTYLNFVQAIKFPFSNDGEDIEGLPSEGVEITCFHLDGTHYMIYTPSDPLLFVAVKDKNGALQIADDDLLEDLAVIGAIDEETEFNALVEEEAALLESLLGKDD
uniref:Uncharacterized protein n=1 Tax=Ananas comosus var. bracteatus TaxID=296719 RepID=A0A6V7NI78_ANACO|nr:unnamed protein product [Ananas comosus var. bracteatus]